MGNASYQNDTCIEDLKREFDLTKSLEIQTQEEEVISNEIPNSCDTEVLSMKLPRRKSQYTPFTQSNVVRVFYKK